MLTSTVAAVVAHNNDEDTDNTGVDAVRGGIMQTLALSSSCCPGIMQTLALSSSCCPESSTLCLVCHPPAPQPEAGMYSVHVQQHLRGHRLCSH